MYEKNVLLIFTNKDLLLRLFKRIASVKVLEKYPLCLLT